MKADVNKVWALIDDLSLEEKKILYKKMQKDINSKLIEIMQKVTEKAEIEPISLKEITDEVELVRGRNHG